MTLSGTSACRVGKDSLTLNGRRSGRGGGTVKVKGIGKKLSNKLGEMSHEDWNAVRRSIKSELKHLRELY